MSKPNTNTLENNQKSFALEKMRLRCIEILEKYRKNKYISKTEKSTEKEKNTKPINGSPINEPLDNFPALKKFINENDKYHDTNNKQMFESGCGKLERALFRAIANQNIEFVENLIELGVNVNIKTKISKPIKVANSGNSARATNVASTASTSNGSHLFHLPHNKMMMNQMM